MNESALALPPLFSSIDKKVRFQNVKVKQLNAKSSKSGKKTMSITVVGPFICFAGQDGSIKHLIFIDGYVVRDGFEFKHPTAVMEPTAHDNDSLSFEFRSDNEKAGFIKAFYSGMGSLKACLKDLTPDKMKQMMGVMDCMSGAGSVYHDCIAKLCNDTLLQFEFQVHGRDPESGVFLLFRVDFQFNSMVSSVFTTPGPLRHTVPDGCCFAIRNGEGVCAYLGVKSIHDTIEWILSIYTWNFLAGSRAAQNEKGVSQVIDVEDVEFTPKKGNLPELNTGDGKHPGLKQTSPKLGSRIGSPRSPKSPSQMGGAFTRGYRRKKIDLDEEKRKLEEELLALKREHDRQKGPGNYTVPVLSDGLILSPSFEGQTLNIQVDTALEWTKRLTSVGVCEYRRTHDRTLNDLIESTCMNLDKKRPVYLSAVRQYIANFPEFQLDDMQKATQPIRPLITEVAQIIQEIQSQQDEKVHEGVFADRLCFLIAAVLLNGFMGDSFGSAIADMERHVTGLSEARGLLRGYDDLHTQASRLSIWLINTNALLPLFRAVLRDDVWQNKYYKVTSYMHDDETVEMLFYLLSSAMKLLEFDITVRNTIIQKASPEDKELFLDAIPYSYLEFDTIDPELKGDSLEEKVVEITMNQLNIGKKYNWSVFSDFASKSATILNMDCREFIALIRGVKWNIDDVKRIEELVKIAVNKGKMHIYFAFLVMSVKIARKYYPADSSVCDPYRAAYVISSLTRLMDRISDPNGLKRKKERQKAMAAAAANVLTAPEPMRKGRTMRNLNI